MKRRILTLLLAASSAFAFTFGLTACDDGNKDIHNHEYGEWTVIVPATCTEAGEKKRVCSCGEYEVEEIPPLGHDLATHAGKEPTCTEEGYGAYEYCKRDGCGYSTYTELEKIPHVFNGGDKCTVCGTDKMTFALDADGESYVLTQFNDTADGEAIIPSTYNGKPVTRIGENAFYENGGITGVTIPDSVVSIGISAFYNCGNLKSVTVGDGVTVIGELAFADCYGLETVELGTSVKVIDEYAFSQCYSLKEINLPSGLETIGECAFVECESLKSAVLPDGLKTIGDCAFGGCRLLKSFIIPDSVEKIGWGVLTFSAGGAGFRPGDSTNSLTELVISNSITEIPDSAFSMTNISNLIIGKKVETIRYSAFYGCGLLESVVMPKSVTRIESYAFYKCSSLQAVYYEGTAEEWGKITIGRNGNDISVAQKYFYSETQPAAEGDFWHYVDGKPVKW